MIKARFVPLDLKDFPNPRHPAQRKLNCPFKSSYTRTLDLLEAELDKLGATEIEIHIGVRREEIRNDGWPRSEAKCSHPAAILTFRPERDRREYSFPCDMFAHWQVNLHAIAYTLKALRDFERYGVGRGNEQYSGFAQLPAPQTMTVEESVEWLADLTRIWIYDVTDYRSAYRAAAALVHPDRIGTDDGRWAKLQQIKQILDAHFKL